jgi:copper chaperone CopZ
MEQKTFKVPNVGCNGCVNTIKGELQAVAGVKTVNGEVASKMITVEYDAPATWDKIVTTLKEIDYAPEQA